MFHKCKATLFVEKIYKITYKPLIAILAVSRPFSSNNHYVEFLWSRMCAQ